jgi:hypothetical protein
MDYMKFMKIKLDESLFDDEMSMTDSYMDNSFMDDSADEELDPDFMDIPDEGFPTGIADNIMRLINDEWEAIQGYNNFAELLRNANADDNLLTVIKDIAAEENKHVGQLQEMLKIYSPNAEQISVGEREAKSQMMPKSSMISGIQFWDVAPANEVSAPIVDNECCTLSDVDDEW